MSACSWGGTIAGGSATLVTSVRRRMRPAQMPCVMPARSTYSAHSSRTPQEAQVSNAFRFDCPRPGKNQEVGFVRHAASCIQVSGSQRNWGRSGAVVSPSQGRARWLPSRQHLQNRQERRSPSRLNYPGRNVRFVPVCPGANRTFRTLIRRLRSLHSPRGENRGRPISQGALE